MRENRHNDWGDSGEAYALGAARGGGGGDDGEGDGPGEGNEDKEGDVRAGDGVEATAEGARVDGDFEGSNKLEKGRDVADEDADEGTKEDGAWVSPLYPSSYR